MTIFKDVEVHAFGKVFFKYMFFQHYGSLYIGHRWERGSFASYSAIFGYVVFFLVVVPTYKVGPPR